MLGSHHPQVLVSKYNRLPDGRYFETESSTSWEFDHVTQVCLTLKLVLDIAKLWQKASSPQSYRLESLHAEFIKSLLKSFSTHASEHYSSPTYGVYPFDDQIAMLLVANRYSPSNFWNGRWRSTYLYNPSSGSLQGTINVNVHYYEDGNVALTTKKPVDISVSGGATEVVRKIAGVERAYQEELNRAFVAMNEQSFKGLRRQLPVTRQKVEWEKVGGYRLGSDLRGGAR